MPILTLEESNYAGLIPEDEILPAKVTGVKQNKKPFPDENGNDIWRLEFSFVIEDPDSPFDGTRVWGDTSTTFTNNPNCKLWSWSQELLATELPVGYDLDTDTLVGQRCRVVIGVRKWQDKVTKEDKERNFVRDVIRSADSSYAYSGPQPGAQPEQQFNEEPF